MAYEQKLDVLRREYDMITKRIRKQHEANNRVNVIQTALFRKNTSNKITHIDRRGNVIASTTI